MKQLLVLLMALALTSLSAQADDFAGASWIGAITRANARLPEGRIYSGTALKDSAVKAAWAAVDTLSHRSIVLQRQFAPRYGREKISCATAYICGLGFYELSINDHRVGDAMLSPLWSDYDKTVYYNTYDVTGLCRGSSASPSLTVSVLLGNGFYNEQGGRYHKMKISFGPPTLLFRLHLEYQNGRTEDLVSDGTWQYSLSAITFNSIYGGEDYDARWQPSWRPVVMQEAPRGELRPQIAEPIKIMEKYKPALPATAIPSGEGMAEANSTRYTLNSKLSLYDMGQNLAGFPEITVRGQAGQTVKLTVGETLTDDGHVNQRQTGRPHYYIYTLKGDGTETWHPRFSYYGFRYIEVETEAELLSLRSCFIYNSARQTGRFECSNPLLNEAYRLIDRAVRSNWQGVWTDCPHREKLGWLEQDWLNGEGLMHNYDCRAMIEQTVRNIADAQHPNGAIPTTAPQYTVFPGETWGKPFNESPEWGGAFIALPYNYWRFYGSDQLIREHFPAMCRYVDYLHSQDSCGILDQGLGDWYDYVDGEKAGFARNTSVRYVATAHLYLWTQLMSQMATTIGRDTEARRYALRADSIREAMLGTFYDSRTHRFDAGSQCAQAIALEMQLVPAGDRQAVLDSLITDIQRHGNRLTTGDVGNRYLFNALMNNGQADLLYTMLNHYETPGYGYQIRLGHTTLTEQWNPEYGSSMNHFMMGHLMNLLIPRFLGIDVAADRISICPTPVGDLSWCRGQTECPQGRIVSEWHIDNGRFTIDFELPIGTSALVTLPFSHRSFTVESGKHHYEDQ